MLDAFVQGLLLVLQNDEVLLLGEEGVLGGLVLRGQLVKMGFGGVGFGLGDVLRRRQARIEDLYGPIEYPPDWNPKAMRLAKLLPMTLHAHPAQ